MISPIGPSKVASQLAMPNSNINDYRDVSFTDVQKLAEVRYVHDN